MKKYKKYLILGGILVIITVGTILIFTQMVKFGAPEPEFHVSAALNWIKPVTDAEWAEDTKKEGLDIRLDFQLEEMEISLTKKLPKLQKDLDKYLTCPECIKYELRERFTQMFNDAKIDTVKGKIEGKTLQEWIDTQFTEDLASKQLDVDYVVRALERIVKEKELRKDNKVDRTMDILSATPSTEKEKEAIQELKTLKGIQ